jgi:peroxiredoxin Q/BCP
MLEVGTKAPQFNLLNQDGKEISLSGFKGKKVVLYFYSKDNTSGCTKQACGFAERYPDFLEKGAEIIGVSKDSVESHRKFADKYNLTFTLLSDIDKKVIEEYDVWKEKTMYGKKVMGVVRTTYLIDEEGIITKAFNKVNATKNPEDMLDTI